MKHQNEALSFLANKDNAGLFFEMGLGKTLIMLEHLSTMSLQMKYPFPCLIVCPLSVVSVWEEEVKKFNYPFKTSKLIGTRQERLSALESRADIYIINYDGLRIIGEALKQKGFNTIILDESHRIKERSSKQTTVALELGQLVKYRYVLTGTPVTKSPTDVWTQLQWVSPGSLGNFYSFRGRYINFRHMTVRAENGLREIKIPYSFKNLKELEEKISKYCLRRTKAECLDLPEKIYKTIYYEMSSDQIKHYYSLKHSLATMLEDSSLNVNAAIQLMQKLQQVCQGFLYDGEKNTHRFESGKLSMLKDVLEDVKQDKNIVFSWFNEDIISLHKTLLDDGHKVLLYDGDSEERSDIVREFQTSKDPCIFLAQIEKAKEGITLTEASNVIYFGNSLNYATRKQSEDRAHRTGQSKHVVYYDFVCKDSIDEHVLALLKNKEGVADKITGDSVRLAKMLVGDK